MNINDEISKLVTDTKKIFEIDLESKDALLEDSDCSDYVGSLNIESLEKLQNFQTGVMQYLRKETKDLNKKINENYSFIFSLEDELLMKDALTDGQSKILKDLKNDYGDPDSRSETFETSFLEQNRNSIYCTSNQSVLNEILTKS